MSPSAGVSAVLVTSSFPPGRGGIESYLSELCAAVAPRLAVVAPGRREGRRLPTDLPYPVHAGPGRMLIPGSRVVNTIVRTTRRYGTERIVFGTPWPLLLAAPALAKRGLRYAVIVHGAELILPGAVPVLRTRLAHALARA
ncbi:MAG: hypothetical protein M3238_03500, partial [Actinomycetota bacterium]|nr:hypothetical protein [Actinomycetota bacterium]